MKRTRLPVAAILLATLTLGCNEPQEGSDGDNKNLPKTTVPTGPCKLEDLKPYVAGIHQQIILEEDDSRSSFVISVPKGYDGKKPAPLIVALHFGGSGLFYSRGILEGLVQPAFKDIDPIIVAPDVLGRRGWGTEENEKRLLALMAQIENVYNIDKEKVIVTGFSMGGHGTFYMASRNQERFKAAIPIAGRARLDKELTWKIPLRIIHSNGDKTVAIGPTKTYAEEIKKAGADVEFVELDGVPHHDARLYVDALKGSVPWLQKQWKKEDNASSSSK